eukprot:SAG11_NODE_2238_length_3640_cov_11.873239_2_plen_109_part_00
MYWYFKTRVIRIGILRLGSYSFRRKPYEILFLHEVSVFSCLGSGPPGFAHLVELRLKLRIDPKIVASGPLVWELRHLQRGHFGAAAVGALMKYWYVLLYPSQFWYSRY